MFGIYVVVGLRAMFGIYVVGGLRVMFFAGFGNLPVQGRCCRNFESTLTIFALFCRRTYGRDSATLIVFVGAAGLPAPRRLATAPTLHRPATRTSPPP